MNHSSRIFNFARKYLIPRLEKNGIQVTTCPYSNVVTQNILNGQLCNQQNHTTYGQPTASTHPHLLKPGELIPGIKLDEFAARRKRLVEHVISEGYVGKSPHRHILIIPSATKSYMSDKIPYVFRQNTDFLYFAGCQEPDSILVIAANNDSFESTLFLQKKDPHSELWDGPRTGVEAATEMFGVDRSLPITEFESFFKFLIRESEVNCVWYQNEDIVHPDFHKKILQTIEKTGGPAILSPKKIFHSIRLIKSESEVKLMQNSCKIASAAIAKTIEISKAGMNEHELFATVDYECRMNGAEFLAYPPVVAGGKNANIIHYITNNQIVRSGDMVLMDAGCEYHGYSSDITRTWPINGTFSPHQRILYEIVLDIQKTLIHKLEEFPTLDEVFYTMCHSLGERLQEIGLIPKSISGNELMTAAYSYCPHHVSHYLGMDVHDSGKTPRSIKTQPGMIITMEPGVYVSPKNPMAPVEFHNLGIRIEDDILLQDSKPLNLTQSCPKEIEDIERLAKCNQ